ncbi:MAG: hypothetical protein ACOVSW_24230 [Candidatus Kapaibacteriota bacterium]|jgi:hypothetical protein
MTTSSFSPRQRLALASVLFVSVHILRELWAYYNNWRSVSRLFDEEIAALSESIPLATSTVSE